MAIFDYKGRDARGEVSEAFQLARYSQLKASGALGDALGALAGTPVTLPHGWRELTASELGVSPDRVDAFGFFTGETSSSAQAKIMGFVGADGSIERVSVGFTGTSDPGDIPAYFALSQGAYIEEFRYLLDATAAFSSAQGLTGEDVVVTGYSLGGAAVNILATQSGEISGGFFATSNYFGFSSPIIHDDSSVILNIGAENDVVFRLIGNDDQTVAEGLAEAAVNEDNAFDSSTDNIVIFNDAYASPLFPFGTFGLLNLAGGWNAHVSGLFSPVVDTIINSTFSDLMEKDSAIVVSQLSDLTRGIVWVEDAARSTSSHHGDPAFILGSQSADLLRDGKASDFLDGFAGNDRFSLSTGNDVVAGGSGSDTVQLSGSASQYQAIHLSDGTLVLDGSANGYGLKELVSAETVQFGSGLFPTLYSVGAAVLDNTSILAADIRYASHREGTTADDTLIGTGAADRLFGLAGADTLSGGAGNDLLHGGFGDDRLLGQAGNDRLFGGVGTDVLVGGLGDDQLSGGLGDDAFDFASAPVGRDTVTDFDANAEEHDVLIFSAAFFRTVDAVLSSLRQVGENVELSWTGGSVVLQDTLVASIASDDILLA